MHVALVRQRYSAHGGAERFIERALGALSEQGVAVTVLAREWTGDPGRVIRCDPFHIGRLWRDWSFARAVCREIARRPFDFVQSHERIACCDIYRAGDGVHAQWLHNRRAIESQLPVIARTLNLPGEPFAAVFDWVLGFRKRLRIPHSLAEIGVPLSNPDTIGHEASLDPSAAGNPLPTDAAGYARIFRSAVKGDLNLAG